ncbi:MAG: alkaline phosphatase family protein [bacterium]
MAPRARLHAGVVGPHDEQRRHRHRRQFSQAARLLERYEFVTVHLKGTDVAGHDRRPLEKRDFISAADAALGRMLEDVALSGPLRVVVTADHGTSSMTGKHTQTPVPLLISSWDSHAEQADFDEVSAAQGELGLVESDEFARLLWSYGDDPLAT